MQPTFPREEVLQRLAEPGRSWDFIVVGGGASGLGAALEAVSRGYTVLLIEGSDFAKGTSSRSTKLVHGGVRYLAQGELKLVREASIERGRLLRNAPGLVHNQTFLVPVYSLWEQIKYTIGLKLYDSIAGTWSMGSSHFLGREAVMQRMPGLNADGLRGAVSYQDGQFDDASLAMALLHRFCSLGGDCLNYLKVTGLVKDNGVGVSGVLATDVETGQAYSFTGMQVLNCTGVFSDTILAFDRPGAPATITASQGVHLVLDGSFFPSRDALMIPKTSDGRVLFAVRWHEKLLIGTTDTPVEGISEEPVAMEREIEFILTTAARYLLRKPSRSDVLSVFAGLRPLAAPFGSGQATREISRSHRVVSSNSGLLSLIGGKWTTYRKMGEDLINTAERRMGRKPRPSGTRDLSLVQSASANPASNPAAGPVVNPAANMVASPVSIPDETMIRLAIEHNFARTVEDILARRSRLLFLDAREAVRQAPVVANLMASILQKDERWIHEQIHSFNRVAAGYVL